MSLSLIWYGVIGISMIAYAILDGFDLGVGCLHLFSRSDRERQMFFKAIDPVWDGNEVWLVIIFGGLFAGFPPVYSFICSTFYSLIMLLIAGLILRIVSIGFRSKHPHPLWRWGWDILFTLSSLAIALSLGILLAHLIRGLPIDHRGYLVISFVDLLTPYALLIAVTGIFSMMVHGALYLVMKVEGDLQKRVRRWAWVSFILLLIGYFLSVMVTMHNLSHAREMMWKTPWSCAAMILPLLAMMGVCYCLYGRREKGAFLFSCLTISSLLIIFGLSTFPNFVRSTLDPQFSLTYNRHSASTYALTTLLIVISVGLPLVFVYGFWIYRTFKGKVSSEEELHY